MSPPDERAALILSKEWYNGYSLLSRPADRLSHIFDHGMTEQEVHEVLSRPDEDRAGAGDSRVAIGQTRAGQHLKLICVNDTAGEGVFVITAFDLVGKPLKELTNADNGGDRGEKVVIHLARRGPTALLFLRVPRGTLGVMADIRQCQPSSVPALAS
jgi:hypothetical protein